MLRVIARCVLFVVRQKSLVVDCLSLCCALLSLLLRAVAVAVAGFLCYWSVCVCRIHRSCAVLLAGCLRDQMVFFFPLSLSLPPHPPSLSRSRVSIQNVPVYVQNVPVCTGTTRTFVSTCGHVAGTHGVDTRSFHGATQHTPHHTPHRTHTTTQDTTQHNNTTTTAHGDRERQGQRQRDRGRERRQGQRDKRREDKRRQNKTRLQEKMKEERQEKRRQKKTNKDKT